MPLSPIWDAVKNHFFDPATLSRVDAMRRAEVQVEGWFKGELIWLFTKLEEDRAVGSWTRESLTGNGLEKVDFKVEFADTTSAIEIKAALCGRQKGQMWRLRQYVNVTDIKRLVAIQADHRYLVFFAYPAPEQSDWFAVVSGIGAKVPGIDVTSPGVTIRQGTNSASAGSTYQRGFRTLPAALTWP